MENSPDSLKCPVPYIDEAQLRKWFGPFMTEEEIQQFLKNPNPENKQPKDHQYPG